MSEIFRIHKFTMVLLLLVQSSWAEPVQRRWNWGREPGMCVQAACAQIGFSYCRSEGSSLAVAQACSMNFDGRCLDRVCENSGSCDSVTSVLSVANSCSDNYGSYCLELVCKHLGQRRCNELSEMMGWARECRNVSDSNCISVQCENLSFNACADESVLRRIVASCRKR